MTRSRVRWAVSALAAGTLVLGACSSNSTVTESPAPEPSPTVTASESASATPQESASASPQESAPSGPNTDSGAALDAVVARTQALISVLKKQSENVYSDIRISGEKPDTLIYTYVFKAPRDPEVFKKELPEYEGMLKKTVEDYVYPDMRRAGVVPVQRVRYEYFNPDGSELASVTLSSDGS